MQSQGIKNGLTDTKVNFLFSVCVHLRYSYNKEAKLSRPKKAEKLGEIKNGNPGRIQE